MTRWARFLSVKGNSQGPKNTKEKRKSSVRIRERVHIHASPTGQATPTPPTHHNAPANHARKHPSQNNAPANHAEAITLFRKALFLS